MKITIESTEKIVNFIIDGKEVPARIWEGKTSKGTPVHCFITRIAPAIEKDDLTDEQLIEFSKDLKKHRPPSPAVKAYDLRLLL